MSPKLLIFLAGAVVVASPVFAKTSKKNNKPVPQAAPEAAPDTAPDASERQRVGKHHMLAVELLGVQTSMGLGSGFRYGYYLNSDSIIAVQVAFASKKASSGDDDFGSSSSDSDYNFGLYDAQRVGKSQLFEVEYKHFATNSFYWSAGLGDRQTDSRLEAYKDSFFDDNEDRTTIARAKTHDLGVSGAIGNQWQWDNFLLGCDWIGLYLPLAHLSQTKGGEQDLPDGSGIAKARQSYYDDEKEMNVQGLRFYLGASF